MRDYVAELMAKVKAKNPAETEFHQAVQEVVDSLAIVLEQHPEYRSERILERIIEPDDSQFLRQLVFFHMEKTGSARARQILDTWSESLLHVWKVQPRSQPYPLPRRTVPVSSPETANV